jgi:hypothetical protein
VERIWNKKSGLLKVMGDQMLAQALTRVKKRYNHDKRSDAVIRCSMVFNLADAKVGGYVVGYLGSCVFHLRIQRK